MAHIYLSPSLQDFKTYITGGSERQYMNLIADAMLPLLLAAGVRVTRNMPGDSVDDIVNRSNSEACDLHIALHSTAAPPLLAGALQGPDVYYYTYHEEGRRAADIFFKNLKAIYPDPDRAGVIPNTTFPELRRIEAPAVLIELGYHDNLQDVEWICGNIDGIAQNLALSALDFLGLPSGSTE